jgi:hypothetical protein
MTKRSNRIDYIKRTTMKLKVPPNKLTSFVHQGPLQTSDKDYNGSTNKILVKLKTGETTNEPLDLITEDDPISCAEYANTNGLLDIPGWNRFKRRDNSEKKIERMVNKNSKAIGMIHFRSLEFWSHVHMHKH